MTRFEMYCISREIRPSPEGSKNISSRNYFINRGKVNKNKSDWHYQWFVGKHVLQETGTVNSKVRLKSLSFKEMKMKKLSNIYGD